MNAPIFVPTDGPIRVLSLVVGEGIMAVGANFHVDLNYQSNCSRLCVSRWRLGVFLASSSL